MFSRVYVYLIAFELVKRLAPRRANQRCLSSCQRGGVGQGFLALDTPIVLPHHFLGSSFLPSLVEVANETPERMMQDSGYDAMGIGRVAVVVHLSFYDDIRRADHVCRKCRASSFASSLLLIDSALARTPPSLPT